MEIMEDTIAAIATAVSEAGISIVRISGKQAIETAARIFRSGKKDFVLEEQPSHTIHYGFIYDGEERVDEVLLLLMKGPHSYTGEDTVEIDCHGGVYVTRQILETVIRHGARLAEPGEFTKRAFLNGKMDLTQAEAVGEIISSRNAYALHTSVEQLKGSVKEAIGNFRKEILYHLAFIESALDDPEHISLDGYAETLGGVVNKLRGQMQRLIATFDNGRMCREGIRTVIIGKPNAGKSSLMNVLVGEERAIVTDVAGTTRDTLEEQIQINGISLNIIDTAGIRKTEDTVEKIGIQRAVASMEKADLILYVADGSVPLNESDEEIIDLIRDRKAIVLLNKTDLETVVTEEDLRARVGAHPVLSISAREEKGIDQLEEVLKDLFFQGEISFNDQVCITNLRQKRLLEESLAALDRVEESLQMGMPEDFYSIDLMDGYEKLGRITGEAVDDDLADEIFAKFCMGK
ncbi:tRNA uridine-5-carboxymethylaminomethyl(34) synthesis GTPase MnmE [Oscillospiraceae bacterium Marseille-Q3528]|nr:tRNA uridine-5-carboxymethylaminomethyl(34) synthesis GTPase MnmE [Oscillospiraceae bacterium Marseille-Q3528]